MGSDTPLNKSWPGSPRSSACTTPSRDNSFLNVSDLFSPYKRTQNEGSQAADSNLLTPASVRQRRITLHSPMDAFQCSYGYEPEDPMDWTSAMMAKLPARFLNGKSSVQLERPPDIMTNESTNKPKVKQDESNKETKQEKEGDADDKDTTDLDLQEMKRSIYERAFCKQQSCGVQFRKEAEITEVKKDDELEQPKKFLNADSRYIGTAEKRDRRLSSDKRSFPPPLHPGISVMSELSPLSPAWYPSPTETPHRANQGGTPHLPSKFLKAMQTLEQPDIDLPPVTNQKLNYNLLSNESIQNSVLSNGNSDDNQNVQNNLSANQNSSRNQNIQNGCSAKKAIHEESTRDVQTLDNTGGNIDLEPWSLDSSSTRNIAEPFSEQSGEQGSKAIKASVEDINQNTTALHYPGNTSSVSNHVDTSPNQTQEPNNNLEHNKEQDQPYVSGHNLKGVTDHLANSDQYACEAHDVVPSLAHPYMKDTQSFEVTNDIHLKQLPVTEQNSVTCGAPLRRNPKSESISDVETPRSFIDEGTKFQDVFVNSCDQSEPLFEAVNQSDKTTPRKCKQVNSSNQSQSMLETSDNTEASESVFEAENQSEDYTQRTHGSKVPRKYSGTITRALSREVADYEPELQDEISRDRKLDTIRYISLERDNNDTYDLKGNTRIFNYDVAGAGPNNSRRETIVEDSSQEVEGLKRELDQGSTGNKDEHAQEEEKRKKNLVDATSVVTQTLTAMLKDTLKTFQKGKGENRRHEITHQKHAHSGPKPKPGINTTDETGGLHSFKKVEKVVAVHSSDKQIDRKSGRGIRKTENKVRYQLQHLIAA